MRMKERLYRFINPFSIAIYSLFEFLLYVRSKNKRFCKEGYITLSKELLPDLADEERSSTYDLYISSHFWPVNGGLGQEGIDHWKQLEQKSGGLPADLPAQEKWLDTTFIQNYIKNHPVMDGN